MSSNQSRNVLLAQTGVFPSNDILFFLADLAALSHGRQADHFWPKIVSAIFFRRNICGQEMFRRKFFSRFFSAEFVGQPSANRQPPIANRQR